MNFLNWNAIAKSLIIAAIFAGLPTSDLSSFLNSPSNSKLGSYEFTAHDTIYGQSGLMDTGATVGRQ